MWTANLNPRSGTEPGKARPVLIVQAQPLLAAQHPSILVAPLATRLVDGAESLRTRILAAGDLRRDSEVLIDQLPAIDKQPPTGPRATHSGGRAPDD